MSDIPYGTLALLLHLSRLRAEHRVGAGLARAFPTEASWAEATASPDLLAELTEFGQLTADLREEAGRLQLANPQSIADAAGRHYSRALEIVGVTAEALGVPPDDLLAVLVNA